MEQLPAEIWHLVLENLDDFRDSQNASNTYTLWRDILDPLKSSWLFGQTLPLIFEHFSKTEILYGRLVCRKWCFGVDYFLENNPYHRPVSWKDANAVGVFKTDHWVNLFGNMLMHRRLDYNYNFGNVVKREKLVSKASNHSRCPIVGRSLYLSDFCPHENIWQSNLEYLKIFGRHVSFLKISIRLNLVECLAKILTLLSFVPNLKSLEICGKILIKSESEDRQKLSEFMQAVSTSYGRRVRLPELETLYNFMTGDLIVYWNECLMSCLGTETLQSLNLYWIINLSRFRFDNLVELSVKLYSDADLDNVSPLALPRVRRLSLELSGHVQSHYLFAVVKLFRASLRYLEVNLSSNYFNGDPLENKEFKSFSDRSIFSGHGIDLKGVNLKGITPPSLNFLLGLTNSLVYLNVTWAKLIDLTQPYCDSSTTSMNHDEEMDLLERLQNLPRDLRPTTYKSNVWKIFWRLKVVNIHWSLWDFECRRDAYDKQMEKNQLLQSNS